VDPNDPNDWYRDPVHPSGNVEMYQHPAFWDNRQHPRLYQAFADVLQNEKLWVSIDRAAMRPPQREDQPRYQSKLVTHWDFDTATWDTAPLRVQGVLALVDTSAELGGFTCVPGFHKVAGEWLKTRPEDERRTIPDLSMLPAGYELVPVPMKAGDLVIWDMKLAHGNGYNVSDRPRLAQYITMHPAGAMDSPHRDDRVRWWKERLNPPYFPGDPRRWEQEHGTTAELTPLGRKLLGLDAWE
jgi:hypothetical protein